MGLILTTGCITGMILQVVWVHSLPFPVCQSSGILNISPQPKPSKLYHVFLMTLQGTNVSHLWKRNIMLKRNIIFPHVFLSMRVMFRWEFQPHYIDWLLYICLYSQLYLCVTWLICVCYLAAYDLPICRK